MDVMHSDLLPRRLDGIDLYLWVRLVVGLLVLAALAGLGLALV